MHKFDYEDLASNLFYETDENLPMDCPLEEHEDFDHFLTEIIDELTPFEKKVLLLRYSEHEEPEEIAEHFDQFSECDIEKTLKGIHTYLRQRLMSELVLDREE